MKNFSYIDYPKFMLIPIKFRVCHFVTLQQTKSESENSWTLNVADLGDDCDLSVKNPNKPEIVDNRTAADILSAIANLNSDSARLINEIKEML